MCDGGHTVARVAGVSSEVEAFTGERIPLRPVRRVHVTTLVDNALDVLAADIGPARRHPLGVVGGFHLTGALFEPIIGPTVQALGELGPQVVVPAHCTGWQAMHELADRMTEAFIPNSIGTRLELTAARAPG